MNKPPKPSNDELRALASDVDRLSHILTRERDTLPSAYLTDERLRKAYQAYFLPSNLSKIHKPLQELFLHPRALFSKPKLRVLDIGVGPGTASLGLLAFFAQQERKTPIEFMVVDQVAGNLKEAEELLLSSGITHGVEVSLRKVQSDINGLGNLAQGLFDVIILSNVLNELFAQEEARIVKRVNILTAILKRRLADEGSCIIIEPSLRETSRDMLEVRDGMLDQGLHLYSPCLFNAKCPALTNPKDWCHEDIPWEPPAPVKELDKLTGLRKDSLKFSYLVLRKDRLSLSDVRGPSVFRVVSEPLVSKGKIEFFLCGAGKRKLVTRMDKDRTDLNQAFEMLKRGDVVGFEQLMDEGKRFKIGKETVVKCAG